MYCRLRGQGFSPKAAIKQMDLLHGVERTEALQKKAANAMEEKTEAYQRLTMGMEYLTEVQWQNLKNAILLSTAQRPGPNAGASITAIREIDKQRTMQKFGTREAAEQTLAWCRHRREKIMQYLKDAAEHGVTVDTSGTELADEVEGQEPNGRCAAQDEPEAGEVGRDNA